MPLTVFFFLSWTRVSWTTSFRTKTASSSSPRCMAAKGPSPCLGPLGVGRAEESDNPLGPYFQIFLSPLAAFSLCPLSSLQAGKRVQVLKMRLSQAHEQGKAGRLAGAWAKHSFSQQLRWGTVPLSVAGLEGVCVATGPCSCPCLCVTELLLTRHCSSWATVPSWRR